MMSDVEILLVEDNPEDAEITLRAFQKIIDDKVHFSARRRGSGGICSGRRLTGPRSRETPMIFGSEVAES